ncbi:hypothetical protein HWV62_40842 [Athelia sp. TMB]|nr:hypothetical protein HWV62_40842 [Athelia sp. TMB]
MSDPEAKLHTRKKQSKSLDPRVQEERRAKDRVRKAKSREIEREQRRRRSVAEMLQALPESLVDDPCTPEGDYKGGVCQACQGLGLKLSSQQVPKINSPTQGPEADAPSSASDSLADKLRNVRQKYHTWSYADDWGSEQRWRKAFHDELRQVEELGTEETHAVLTTLRNHCAEGRQMIRKLKDAGSMPANVCSDAELVRDLVLQTMDLYALILSETTFIELGGRKSSIKAFGEFARLQQNGPSTGRPTKTAGKPLVLSPAGIVKHKQNAAHRHASRRQAMSRDELNQLAQQAASSAANLSMDADVEMDDYNDIIHGHQPIEISHAGGEIGAIAAAVIPRKMRRVDWRKRRDRNEKRQQGFNLQIEALTDAYTLFIYHRDHTKSLQPSQAHTDDPTILYHITAQDTLSADDVTIAYPATAISPCPAIVAKGIIPTAPQTPTLGFTVENLELYRVAHFRCPQLSIQAWVRTMADLQGGVYARHRSKLFSIAYDLYLAIRANAQARVNSALGRSDPNWNIKNVCPPCMYRVEGEQNMKFSMLWAEDGNDSLKRFERRALPEEGGPLLGPLIESIDTRVIFPGNMYISRTEVDKWAMPPGTRNRDPEEDDDGTCRERWKNMKPEATARSWGCFGETGIFASFCRHGFNLTIADMYRSGEQSKYGLATAARMLEQHGANQGAGLDIGCSHSKTLANSMLGPRAKELNHTVLVDAFHGHAHNRLCQLNNLTTYVDGLGLEALGVCEQAFSKSNMHAGSTRSMGRFRRRQAIAAHFRDTDNFENYMSMTTYIHTMYKKALDILKHYPAALEISKAALGIAGESPFESWLAEEKEYLRGLKKEPPQETLTMEYHQRLTHLWHCEEILRAIRSVQFHTTDPTTRDNTHAIEARRRHAIENHAAAISHVQSLELRLGIQTRWTAASLEYQETGRMVAMRSYQRALDTLEGLVVARLFELGGMNRAGMGYKRRRHMGEALSTRSAAVRTAVERYNAAALVLDPPRPMLNAQEVIKYAFLSDFDLLRDTRQDIRKRPWATPTGRKAIDQYFKLLRAPEEITRCNNEIRRIVTHLRDEEAYLKYHEERIRLSDPILAHQIAIHRLVRGRFNNHHRRRLAAIGRLEGFSGSLEPGIALDTGLGSPASWRPPAPSTTVSDTPITIDNAIPALTAEELELEREAEDDEEEVEEQEDEADLLNILADK